jgi:hypothetical protein
MSKKKVKKSEKPRFYGQNKLFFENPALQSLGSFIHMAACRSSSENTGKMSLMHVFNKNSPLAHTELELDVLGVHGKLLAHTESELDVGIGPSSQKACEICSSLV